MEAFRGQMLLGSAQILPFVRGGAAILPIFQGGTQILPNTNYLRKLMGLNEGHSTHTTEFINVM